MDAHQNSRQFALLALKVGLILFISELAIMFAIPLLGHLNPWLEALLDAVVATLVSGTLSYYLVLRPLLVPDGDAVEPVATLNRLAIFIAKFGMVIFTVESAIMLVLPLIENLYEGWVGNLLDAMLLSLLSTPMVLFWSIGQDPIHGTRHGRLQSARGLFILLYMPTLLALGLLFLALFHSEMKTYGTVLRSEERQRMETVRREMLRDIRMVVQDLLVLANQVELQELLDGEAEASELLYRDYKNFLMIKRDFDRLRYLDSAGQEQLVVENSTQGPRQLADSERLNKSQRYYFKEAMRVTPGMVYISPLDLRLGENGPITPYQPVVRFATSVFDREMHRRGVIILDLIAEKFLERLTGGQGQAPGTLLMVDEQGYWLHGRPPEELWGGMLKERAWFRFATAYPAIWHYLQEEGNGQVDHDGAIITFRTVSPSAEWQRRDIPLGLRNRQVKSDWNANRNNTEVAASLVPVWKLISIIPPGSETKQFVSLSTRLALLFMVLASLLALGIWNLAKALARRNQAEADLRRHSEQLEVQSHELERMVQERTKQLVHSERLATLGTFSAGMAHEINNPNSFISGNVQFLKKFWSLAEPILQKHENEDPSGRLKMFGSDISSTLDGILDGSQRISKIVDSLKTYSKGGMENDKVDCRLLEPIQDAQNLLRHRLKKGITLTVNVPNEILLYCDRQQISQVFVNLFNNAMDAIEDSGHDKGTIEVRAQELDGRAWIWVKDSGPGIPEQASGKIFDPFYTTKGKTKGTGLGLSIVHGIIQDHKGQITVFSPPEGTTEFLIILPALLLSKTQRVARKAWPQNNERRSS